ncbi:MAG: DUF177 domain-containing protein [Chlamydiae bacterium]|nr:DUF177 domain-containing protein [Chlamydiota bacterium]
MRNYFWRCDMDLLIYVDRLKEGETERIEGSFPSYPLLPKEKELFFSDTIQISGEAYLAGDHLVVHLEASVTAFIPCSVCNEPTKVELVLSDLCHTCPLEEISGHIFDLGKLVREEFLLELPKFTECQGSCPERIFLQKYLQQEQASDTHTPFSSL